MVVLVDDARLETEGELLAAAETVTPQTISFMAAQARGVISLALPVERTTALRLPFRPDQGITRVPIGLSRCSLSPLSAEARAQTILAAIDDRTRPGDLVPEGYVLDYYNVNKPSIMR